MFTMITMILYVTVLPNNNNNNDNDNIMMMCQ